MWKSFIIFLFLNFLALAIGGFFTNVAVTSNWYLELNKAPWTPPGWVFGAAWTLIMICFSFFMAYLVSSEQNSDKLPFFKNRIILLYTIQWILNVGWNPIFFRNHHVLLGLIVIASLTLVIAFLFFNYRKQLHLKSIFILPYFIWLMIATSLNAYILINN